MKKMSKALAVVKTVGEEEDFKMLMVVEGTSIGGVERVATMPSY